jgi:uncharacterized membrane protein YkoI
MELLEAFMKKTVQILLCLCALTLANAATAQVSQSSTLADISAFHGDQGTLIQAIGKIEQSTGGKVVDIRFTPTQGAPGFHAAVVKGGKVSFVHLQQGSQQVTPVDASSGANWMQNWRAKADVHFAEAAPVPLVTAIRSAEQAHNGAPAAAAGIARSASNPESDVHAYNVILNEGGRAKRVAVDDATGEIISDPGALTSY